MKNRDFNPIILSKNEEQVLIGSLLGDGNLRKGSTQKNYYFQEVHTSKQKEYIEWKANLIPNTQPKVKHYKVSAKGSFGKKFKYQYRYLLRTRCSSTFIKYCYLFYRKNKKVVTKELINKVDRLALAIWYLDDGSYTYYSKTIEFSTQCFTKEDNILLQNMLYKKFNIRCSVNKSPTGYRLLLSGKNVKKMLNIIYNVLSSIPKCMRYKFAFYFKENLAKIEDKRLLRNLNSFKYRHRNYKQYLAKKREYYYQKTCAKKLIFLCSFSGAGKTTAKLYLKNKLRKKCSVVEVSDVVDEMSNKGGIDLIGNKRFYNNVLQKIKNTKRKIVVVTGCRELELLNYIRDTYNNIISLAIKCKEEIRTKRLLERGMTKRQIIAKTKKERKIGTQQVMGKCQFSIDNNSNHNDLFSNSLNLFLLDNKLITREVQNGKR